MSESIISDKNLAGVETEAPSQKGFVWKPEYLPWLITIMGLLIGGIGLYQRFAFELRLTALGSFVPWGLWVSTYEYLVWLEIGSLTVYTVLAYIFKLDASLHRMARTLYLTALAILAMALILIGLDLGHPFRFWYVFTHPQWNSLMTWMIWLHIVYLAVLLAKIVVEIRPQTNANNKVAKTLAMLSLPIGIALVVVAGSVFGVAMGRPTWQGSALPLYFLISALVAVVNLWYMIFQAFVRPACLARLHCFRTGQGKQSSRSKTNVRLGVPRQVFRSVQCTLIFP